MEDDTKLVARCLVIQVTILMLLLGVCWSCCRESVEHSMSGRVQPFAEHGLRLFCECRAV